MVNKITAQDLVESALNFPLKQKTFREYVSMVESEIWTSGLNIIRKNVDYSKQGSPIIYTDNKQRKQVLGESFTFNTPEIGYEYGYIIKDIFNLKVQFTVFQIKRKLYMSSYSYHFELLHDKNKFFRYEKSEFARCDDDYKPMFHMHSMGRLPHYPAPFVTIGQLLNNIQTNLFNPTNIKKLDPPWGKIFV